MDIQTIGKWILVMGAVLVVVGGCLLLAGKLGFRGLPGDIRIERGGMGIYFPIVTCIVISIILTVVINLFGRK